MKRPLFRQSGSPMTGENSSEQAFMQYLQANLSPEQLQALMQNPDRDQIIGQLYQKFMSEQQTPSSPMVMRQEGSPNIGERSAGLRSLVQDIRENQGMRSIIGNQEADNVSRQLGDLMRQPFEEFKGMYVRNPMSGEMEPMSGPLTGTPKEDPKLVGESIIVIDRRPNSETFGQEITVPRNTDTYQMIREGMFEFDEILGMAEGGEMESDAVGIASGLDEEESTEQGPMTVDREPSEEGIAKVSPEQYVQLMNEIRGDDVPMEGRVQELAGVVGEKDATDTPLSVLALVQPVFELQEQRQQQEGIANTPQGQQMIQQGPMPMANGGIVYRQTGSSDLGEVTKSYYQQLQNIFPEYGAMQKASLYTPLIKAGLRIASGAPVVGEEDSALTGAIADYTDILPKIASAGTPLKQSALKLASDELIAEKAAASAQKKFQQEFMKDVYLKQMEVEGKKVNTIGVVGSNAEENKKLAERIKDATGVEIDLSAYNAGSLIQMKPSGELDITTAPTDKKIEYAVTYPVVVMEDGKEVTRTKTKVLDLSTPEGIAEYNKLQNDMLKMPESAPLFKFEKISGLSFSPEINVPISPIIRQEKDGGIVYRSTGTPEGGEQVERVGVTKDFAQSMSEATPQYIEGGTYPEIAKGKIKSAEEAMRDIEILYGKALNDPLYVGVLGSGARTGKSVLGAIDDIFNFFGYDPKLPGEDFFFSPIISEIKQAETNIATAVANVRRPQTGRANVAREVNLVKNDLDITGLNSAQGTLDSLKEIWNEMANKANAQRDLLPGVDKMDYKVPEIFSQTKSTSGKDFDTEKLNVYMNLLPPELKEISMNDPDIKNAINAVIKGADPKAVINRLKELKGIE